MSEYLGKVDPRSGSNTCLLATVTLSNGHSKVGTWKEWTCERRLEDVDSDKRNEHG